MSEKMLVRLAVALATALLATGCSPSQRTDIAESGESNKSASLERANVEKPHLSDSDAAHYSRQESFQAPFGRVLVGEYRYAEGEAGHPTPGRLDVSYVIDGQRRRYFRSAVEVGSTGSLAEWEIVDKFIDNPVIYASGGFTNMGITEGCTVLTELRPEGPRKIAMVPDYYSDDGSARDPADHSKPIQIQGRIQGIEKGVGFKVVYRGSERGTFLYRWTGDGFEPLSRPPLEHCNVE